MKLRKIKSKIWKDLHDLYQIFLQIKVLEQLYFTLLIVSQETFTFLLATTVFQILCFVFASSDQIFDRLVCMRKNCLI